MRDSREGRITRMRRGENLQSPRKRFLLLRVYIGRNDDFTFLPLLPANPVSPTRAHRASRESSGDNINPGSFRQASPCQPFVSLANCLPTVLAKWRLRRTETRDCERVIKKSSRKSLSFSSLPSFFRSSSHSIVEEGGNERYAISPLSSLPPRPAATLLLLGFTESNGR